MEALTVRAMHPIKRCVALCAMVAALSCATLAQAEDAVNREYPLLAAYVYNFTQFTSWPPPLTEEQFVLCIMGADPFGALLTPLRSKTVRGTGITLRYHKSVGKELSSCHLLFVSESEQSQLKSIFSSLDHASVLTLSNIEGFADAGGMVEFVKRGSKIGININIKAVEKSGLAISSKLLGLARIVE